MGRYRGTIPLGKKNISKSEWDDFIAWQKSRNDERMRNVISESDIYISSGNLSPETWESLLNESSPTHSENINESPISNNSDSTPNNSKNIISQIDIDSNKRHKPHIDQNLLNQNLLNQNTDSDEDYGPMPLDSIESTSNLQLSDKKITNVTKTSLKGAGMTPEEIERYESLGYVMSGSSYWKLSQAKLKERDSKSEDQKLNSILSREERESRENELINNLKEMLKKQNAMMDKSKL